MGLALVAVVALALLLLRDGEADPAPEATPAGAAGQARPLLATPSELAAAGKASGRPVYWAGPRAGSTLELTRTPDGAVYVRYLPRGVAAGDARPDFLTVGTYPRRDPLATLREAAERPGALVEQLDDDRLAVASGSRPSSWYFPDPDGDALVEVFSPRPGQARELVRGGRVVPVEG